MDNEARKMDVYMVLLYMFFFILFSLLYFYRDKLGVVDFIMTGAVFSIALLAYFNGLVTGLILSAFVIFFYVSYVIYNNILFAMVIQNNVYVWIAAVPLDAFINGNIHTGIYRLQENNMKLKRDYRELITIDRTTGLNNIKGFYTDLNKEMSLSKRHGFQMALMIIKLPYYNEIFSFFGEARVDELLKDISSVINSSTRNEDKRYKVDRDMMAIIMPHTDLKGAEVVKDRIKEGIKDINLKIKEKNKNIDVEVKIGLYQYNSRIKDVFKFKELAQKELEYDV